MKKIYAILTLAAATCISANAATQKTVSAKDAVVSQKIESVSSSVKGMKMTRKDGPKKVTSVDDVLGSYSATWAYWMLEGQDQFNGECSPIISKGDVEGEVVFSYFPYSDVSYVGTVDIEKQQIIIEEQETEMYLPNYNENMKFVGEKGIVEGDKIHWEEGGSLILNIAENGDLYNETDGFGLRVTDGYFFAAAGFILEKPDYFVFNPEEWVEGGTAKFTDNSVANFYKAEYRPGAVDVNLLCNKDNSNLWAIQNPYMQGEWANLNLATEAGKSANGFLVFDLTDPECVLLRPATASGFYFDNRQAETDPMSYSEAYLYNKEGRLFYIGQWETWEIIDDFGAVGDPISTYDAATSTVDIQNILFGDTENPLASYWFGEDAPMTMTIVMSTVGINGVEVDANAPVKYYNLQGLEIANPVKGQLVIKTQGGKAVKTIIK